MKYIAAILQHKYNGKWSRQLPTVLACSPGGEGRRPKGTIERQIQVKNLGTARLMADELERK